LLEIVHVAPGSTGAGLGLRPGDIVLSVSGEEIQDAIDFQFFAAEEHITLVIRRGNLPLQNLDVHKHPDENLGLSFAPLRVKRCRNKCLFCFVDQMPPGCRETLYVKDDDYRASFLYGNFITLGALSEDDWNRIFRQRLSPLYISVHATDPDLRARLLGNKKTPPIMESLKRLAAGGIRMHTQVVLCPGLNDGDHLKRTIGDLASLYPAVSSIGVVPVGITKFRKGLFPTKKFLPAEARAVLDQVEHAGRLFKRQLGTRFVFPSDEFYIQANRQVPSASFYEDFLQIENGIGMVASFLREVSGTRMPSRVKPISATVVTGASFSRILKAVLARMRTIEGASIRQVTVQNRFFGESVTVTGLLTGRDILASLRGKRLGDLVLIPSNVLREEGDVFLDGMSLEFMQESLRVKVMIVDGFRHFLHVIKREGEEHAVGQNKDLRNIRVSR
jgi:putative radical SAM enzyme (TIGR03279 family)